MVAGKTVLDKTKPHNTKPLRIWEYVITQKQIGAFRYGIQCIAEILRCSTTRSHTGRLGFCEDTFALTMHIRKGQDWPKRSPFRDYGIVFIAVVIITCTTTKARDIVISSCVVANVVA